ncbi:MAG TPA: flavin reductase family protein [Stellaceae bacterium]|nr:flavin reductase family protein [Stellaceae bacterium]
MEFDFTTLPPRDRYRLLIGAVVPRPIALVTTVAAAGTVNAAPFSFFNVFSHDPVIVALGIERREGGHLKDTVRNIRLRREFVVNLVNERIAEAMNVCAVDFPEGISELEAAGLTAAPSSAIATPRIKESPVNMECRLMEELRFGEEGKRSIVLGEVVRFHIKDEFLTERGYVDIPEMRPVGRLSGNGYVRLSDRFEMKRENYGEWQSHTKKDAAS